jgi:peptidoglycan-associated lipoprotein
MGGCGTMNWKRVVLFFSLVVMLSGCATMPTGPNVAVLPGPGKPFEVFMADDAICRQWAQQQIGGASPSQIANQNLATGATVGALAGAAMGVAIGAATGNAGAGAAIGGATGLLGGTAMGSNVGASSEYQLQRRYDIAYQQCMYAKGNQIPGGARRPTRAYVPPPPPPPPPPPRVVVVVPPPAPTAVLQDIYFEFNKADIRADAAEILKKNVEWFKQNPGKKVRVEGNTDITGTEKYNMGLGQRRAEATKAYLVKLGIDGALLQTVSYGDTKPVCAEKDEACWAKQRRVHFTPLN